MSAHFERITHLLKTAHEQGASDLHLSAGAAPVLRVQGRLQRLDEEPLASAEIEEMVLVLLDADQAARFAQAGELDFVYELEGECRFRINAFHQQDQVSMAARTVRSKIPNLEDLRLPPVVHTLTRKHQGLILVTGPTGSGKSTTLAAMIQEINRTQSKHIVTLEDPIEYIHEHASSVVNQRQVGTDTASFASGLRAALRQDPDVILVGEMRDLETISAAVTAAETGHLVLATLHTTDAPQTVDRIIDAFPAHQQDQVRVQLANVLVAVISQRLFANAKGTSRMCATEILINLPSVANLIRGNKTHQLRSILQTSKAQGMQTLDMSIKQLLAQGLIDPAAAEPYLQEVGG